MKRILSYKSSPTVMLLCFMAKKAALSSVVISMIWVSGAGISLADNKNIDELDRSSHEDTAETEDDTKNEYAPFWPLPVSKDSSDVFKGDGDYSIAIRITPSSIDNRKPGKTLTIKADIRYARIASESVPEPEDGRDYYSEDDEIKWDAVSWGAAFPVTAYCNVQSPELETILTDDTGKAKIRRSKVLFPLNRDQKDKEVVPYLYFRLCYSVDYRDPNVDIDNKDRGLDYHYSGSENTLVESMGNIPSNAIVEHIYYGSRVGMVATITGKYNLDTSKARITLQHTEDNAAAFCRAYLNDRTSACISETLKEFTIPKEITANCATGEFEATNGLRYKFHGYNPYFTPDNTDSITEYIIKVSGEKEALDASMASGYDIVFSQFKALCPKSFEK